MKFKTVKAWTTPFKSFMACDPRCKFITFSTPKPKNLRYEKVRVIKEKDYKEMLYWYNVYQKYIGGLL